MTLYLDEFTLPIDETKFRRTNIPWNDLCLNDPWSVGHVSTLIEAQTFLSKEQWEQFYYEMEIALLPDSIDEKPIH